MKALHTFLDGRARELLDCEMVMRKLSNAFDESIKTWRSDQDDLTDNELHRSHFATTYIVDCPKQHALPMAVLSGLLVDKHDTNGVEVGTLPSCYPAYMYRLILRFNRRSSKVPIYLSLQLRSDVPIAHRRPSQEPCISNLYPNSPRHSAG